jgi:hypothetical protein
LRAFSILRALFERLPALAYELRSLTHLMKENDATGDRQRRPVLHLKKMKEELSV